MWVINSKDREETEIFERKIPKKIYGGIKEYGEWRRRTNEARGIKNKFETKIKIGPSLS